MGKTTSNSTSLKFFCNFPSNNFDSGGKTEKSQSMRSEGENYCDLYKFQSTNLQHTSKTQECFILQFLEIIFENQPPPRLLLFLQMRKKFGINELSL